MQFTLTGFSQDAEFRVFAFEGISADRIKTAYSIRADLGLIRKYSIRIQELPLICRAILERKSSENEERVMTFTEEDMGLYARAIIDAREAAASKKKMSHKAPSGNLGAAWRAPSPQ